MQSLSRSFVHKQQGAVLIIALIMLLILTILGVAVMESSSLQERMAGNNLDRNRAFRAAEAGLRAGEVEIAGWVEQPIANAGFAAGQVSQLNTSSWWANTDDAWWNANATDSAIVLEGTENPATNLTRNPRYVIEEYDDVCDGAVDPSLRTCKIIYRVTALGWGGRNATVMLQSLFARRY